ncbi:DUF397 domain-containing protein [Streptomyces radicis]|uniref:DUF397 domain-containing protein n=1 Tax=Streptomyces radicis TaxID=1750517 RepID=A0A3A9WH10_9ACTN|nr:DUF397 domain-containing protein [Streptomyces radicis]RKN12100.1 DUF397 domain-containing protein [Streptomyces radicis]RKN25847.1 DUF397 domain-containing protein [Streptomyces radicis]
MNEKADLYTATLDGEWIKSSYSNGNGNDCVRLMKIDGGVALDDSKSPHREPLRYTTAELDAFIRAAKAGEFDHLVEG